MFDVVHSLAFASTTIGGRAKAEAEIVLATVLSAFVLGSMAIATGTGYTGCLFAEKRWIKESPRDSRDFVPGETKIGGEARSLWV